MSSPLALVSLYSASPFALVLLSQQPLCKALQQHLPPQARRFHLLHPSPPSLPSSSPPPNPSAMSRLPCTDPIPVCSCPAGVECVQSARSWDQCPQKICLFRSSGGSGGSPIGGTVGGALGGVLGICGALALVYWFWWKPRGLAASRKRYSRHVTARQSKMMGAPEKKDGEGTVTKRSSVHLTMEGPTAISRGPGSSSADDESMPTSVGATGGHTPASSIDMDNPFADTRSSMNSFANSTRTSDFSFRSSHSTNIIPIAYIPPHSSSMSIDDAHRGAYGETLDTSRDSRRVSTARNSVPMSMASRDSLAMSDAIELNPLPPVLTPGSPAVPLSAATTLNGAPIRPPRSPGLDLKLPQGAPSTSPLSSPNSRDSRLGPGRPPSGFPWDPPSPSRDQQRPALTSNFSSSTRGTNLSPPEEGGPRGISVLFDRAGSAQSHLSTYSTMSSSTSRSGNSTMSYILDPPQIITPVNAQGLRRVEVLGRGQAGLVRIGGSGLASAPTSPAAPLTGNADVDSNVSSPTTPKAFAAQQAKEMNPFSDEASVVTPLSARFSAIGGSASAPLSPTSSYARSESQDTVTSTEPGYATTNESRWTASTGAANGDDTGSRPRPLTSDSQWSDSRRDTTSTMGGEGMERAESRGSYASFASTGTEQSVLDGIPFMAAPTIVVPSNLSRQSFLDDEPPRSPLFPMPPPRSPSCTDSPTSSHVPESEHRDSTYSYGTTYSDTSAPPAAHPSILDLDADADTSPLPSPFLPFAGQRPTPIEGGGRERESSAISVRSGFGSGLSQIPFQLGFPSGLDGGSERGSMMGSERGSMMGMDPSGARDSRMFEESDEEERGLGGIEEGAESRRTSVASFEEASEDPFADEAAVVLEKEKDGRASLDTLAISAELARSFEGLE